MLNDYKHLTFLSVTNTTGLLQSWKRGEVRPPVAAEVKQKPCWIYYHLGTFFHQLQLSSVWALPKGAGECAVCQVHRRTADPALAALLPEAHALTASARGAAAATAATGSIPWQHHLQMRQLTCSCCQLLFHWSIFVKSHFQMGFFQILNRTWTKCYLLAPNVVSVYIRLERKVK